MKYSEFKKEIETMGLRAKVDDGYFEVSDEHDELLLYVDMEFRLSMTTDYARFDKLNENIKKKLFNLATELASTPLEEREDEKRYRLIIPFVRDSVKYLTLLKTTGTLIITHPLPFYPDYQAEFTESEIEELKREHNLDSFVLEEVLEDE